MRPNKKDADNKHYQRDWSDLLSQVLHDGALLPLKDYDLDENHKNLALVRR